MRYRLRTLLILLAVAPVLLSIVYGCWEQRRQRQQLIDDLRTLRDEMDVKVERARQRWMDAVEAKKAANAAAETQKE